MVQYAGGYCGGVWRSDSVAAGRKMNKPPHEILNSFDLIDRATTPPFLVFLGSRFLLMVVRKHTPAYSLAMENG